MKVRVSITFPCSSSTWRKVCRIHALSGDGEEIHAAPFTEIKFTSDPMVEGVTKNEAFLLDKMSRVTHENGETPLMDSLEVDGQSHKTSSIKSLVRSYIQNNNGSVLKKDLIAYVMSVRPDMTERRVISNLYSNCGRIDKNFDIWSIPTV